MEIAAEQFGLSLQWEKTAVAAREAADFAGRVIGFDTRYISHGEIQTGLSPDGDQWAPDLAQLYRDDFAELGDERDLLTCRDGGTIVGIAVVAWEESARRRFAVLEDMAVEPSRRSHGIGERLIGEIEARVAERGIEWLFLESGLENHRAHGFFERHGFKTVSHVFAKRL
ncbi:GNAT family N-acetyltransferase [Sphingomonas soli]|uniref:GNAT family N-acetyltransferase n=1 Tax=Sphingomonas soli TaxID=266127 RepID=UPI00082AF514|nr:GNAT family N-acetyltransferase [Sphingomonas soli]